MSEEQWPVKIYKTQNRRSVYEAVQRELRPNLHERCARAGTVPAATLHSSIPARPRATARVSARACALFRRRNGGQIKRAPHSETPGQRSAGPPTIGRLDRRKSGEKFLCVLHGHQAAAELLPFYPFADLASGRAVLDSQFLRNSSRCLSTKALASSKLP